MSVDKADLILKQLERWASPYSPVSPLELDDIRKEQGELADSLSAVDAETLLSVYNKILVFDKDVKLEYDIFLGELFYRQPAFVEQFLGLLNSDGPVNVIHMLGCAACNNRHFTQLFNTVEYNRLNREGKIELLNALRDLSYDLYNTHKPHFLSKEDDEDMLQLINEL